MTNCIFPSCLFPSSGVSASDISLGRGRSGRSRGRPKGSGGGAKSGGKGRGRKSTAGSAAAMAGAMAGAAAASAAAYAAYGYSVSKGQWSVGSAHCVVTCPLCTHLLVMAVDKLHPPQSDILRNTWFSVNQSDL